MNHPRLEELRQMVRSSSIDIACDAMAIMGDYYQEVLGAQFDWFNPSQIGIRYHYHSPTDTPLDIEVISYLDRRSIYANAAMSGDIVTVDAGNGICVEYSIARQWCRVYGPHHDSGILCQGAGIGFDCPHYYHIPGTLALVGKTVKLLSRHAQHNAPVARTWKKFARLNYGWTMAVSEREMEDFSRR